MNQNDLTARAQELIGQLQDFVTQAQGPGGVEQVAGAVEPFMFLLTIFLLACFVGYYVVWNVTPALHSPLMGVTNAISSVIVVGAVLATGLGESQFAQGFGLAAAGLASVNIFGGFIVTRRMLAMFKSKKG